MKIYMISRNKNSDMYHLYHIDMEAGRFIHTSTNCLYGTNKEMDGDNNDTWDYANWNYDVFTEEDAMLELL